MLQPSELRRAMLGATALSEEVIAHIYKERWLQIWVPQTYGGLGCDFQTGLTHLYNWAKIDGSLGWMLTLCSGANYFARNLRPETAKRLFVHPQTCFGGSGMIGGTAEEQEDGTFIVNGLWHYATGAPYLSHFTLNANVLRKGEPVLDENGTPCVRSFIIPQDQVQIIANWKSMGMKATGTFSFQVDHIRIPEDYQFVYDVFYTDDVVTRIPFRVFADLTLLVNYLGIASHFVEETEKIWKSALLHPCSRVITDALQQVLTYAARIEELLIENKIVEEVLQEQIHQYGCYIVKQLTHIISQLHVQLGIKGTQIDQPIHQVFCDFFTATMHANFRGELTKEDVVF